jgi:hypothetical protein
MRHAFALIIAVIVTAACGFALSAAAGWNPRPLAMGLAAGTALVAGGAAYVPLILSRGASQAQVAQAALVGTLIHLMGCLAGATVLLLVFHLSAATYWIMAFYWATLVALVFAFTRATKAAPPAAPPVKQQ